MSVATLPPDPYIRHVITASAIPDSMADLSAEFDLLGDWEERYRYVIDLGRELAPLTGTERSEANKVRGCASQVWLVTEPQPDRTVRFRGDSDAHIVRGLIAILLRLFSGRRPADILAFDARSAFDRLPMDCSRWSNASAATRPPCRPLSRDRIAH